MVCSGAGWLDSTETHYTLRDEAGIGGEIRRVKERAGLPQSVVEEAESLVKKYFDLVAGFPPEVVAVDSR